MHFLVNTSKNQILSFSIPSVRVLSCAEVVDKAKKISNIVAENPVSYSTYTLAQGLVVSVSTFVCTENEKKEVEDVLQLIGIAIEQVKAEVTHVQNTYRST